jgi:hypothetical protein
MNQLTRAISIGTLAQIAMVVAGHFWPPVANIFAVGGMGISAVAGFLAMKGRNAAVGASAGNGALGGGIGAGLGIAVSVALGDVPASLLGLGTMSSAVTGAIGGLIGRRRG